MKTEKILKPGQPGTKKWVEKFGEDLLCVRYRYDKINSRKLKTVEIIVNQKAHINNSSRIPQNKLIPIQVNYDETYLRKLVKSAGGKWHPIKKVWKLPYGKIIDLGLEKRILKRE